MAVQALAPYYNTNADVKAAVNRGMKAISDQQLSNGGMGSWGTVNSESCAQTVCALSDLGRDADTDPQYVKNMNSILDAMLSFYIDGGGFAHAAQNGKLSVNMMATEQATYALVSYDRFKTGKTTLLKQIAKQISRRYEDMHLLVLLIDERPEEVTDIRESIEGPNVEVIYSTFDELPEHHKRVSEMVIERAKRLVESKKDVVILLDSITRLARAYNLTVAPSGRTLSGGLDPAALHMPKRFFGAARNMREGGSLTILATALVDTGSKMDDVVFEEFKGTGNMELVLDRKLSEKRIFPAIDIAKSGTRRDDLLLNKEEQEVVTAIHKELMGSKSEDILEDVRKLFVRTRNNKEFIHYVKQSLLRK